MANSLYMKIDPLKAARGTWGMLHVFTVPHEKTQVNLIFSLLPKDPQFGIFYDRSSCH